MTNSIFIAATGQNVGKTTVCLGLLSGLQKRLPSVGFIKPVGQQHVKVDGINVDKDVILFKEHFKLSSSYSDMSPVILPNGFTRQYLDGEISEADLLIKIRSSYSRISSKNQFTVVEGTGHVGVGSIIGMNNARIASELGMDMIIIAQGGLGSAFDEIALNVAMCKAYDVNIRGIILNKVLDEKREMIAEYFPKTLKKWDIPLLGCIPYNEFLNTPCMGDFEALFKTSLLSGHKHRYRHFKHTRLIAGSVESYKKDLVLQELIITPASREDIIMATLERQTEKDFKGGMILTSLHPPTPHILKEIQKVDIPILYAPLCSYDAMKMITSFTAKTRTEDVGKIEQAITLVERNINFDRIASETANR